MLPNEVNRPKMKKDIYSPDGHGGAICPHDMPRGPFPYLVCFYFNHGTRKGITRFLKNGSFALEYAADDGSGDRIS